MRGNRVNREKTHCVKGHPLSGENLRLHTNKRGWTSRICRECGRDAMRRLRDRRGRSPRPQPMKDVYDVLERLIICEPTTLETGCWEWPHAVVHNGYGQASVAGWPRRVHRLVYEHFRGPVPDGLELDHLCRNRRCANHDHLEAVPHQVNVHRGEGLAAQNAKKTECVHGHSLAGSNLHIHVDKKGGVHRYCRECARKQQSRYRARAKGGDSDSRQTQRLARHDS